MGLTAIVDAVGVPGLVAMVVCFLAVTWWGLRGRGGQGPDDQDD